MYGLRGLLWDWKKLGTPPRPVTRIRPINEGKLLLPKAIFLAGLKFPFRFFEHPKISPPMTFFHHFSFFFTTFHFFGEAMKLLNCCHCNDIVALSTETRTCKCGKCHGRYLADNLTAVVYSISSEHVRVLGMLNEEYESSKTLPVVPFRTYYKWFPILLKPEHHVVFVTTLAEFQQLATNPLTPITTKLPRHRARCMLCKKQIESLYRHHFVSCDCGNLSLDGGGGEMYDRRWIYKDILQVTYLPTEDTKVNQEATDRMHASRGGLEPQ